MGNKGVVATGALVAMFIIGASLGAGFAETAKNGVLKANGKQIWCQMKGNSKAACGIGSSVTQ